jgi:fumarylacetoacetase
VLTSWVPGADGSGFPAEHLPFGVVSQPDSSGSGEARLRRVGVRIGHHVLDLAQLVRLRLLDGPFDQPVLNPFLAAGPEAWRQVRNRLTELVCDPDARDAVEPVN